MARSDAFASTTRLDRRAGGPAVYAYQPLPGVPPVGIARLNRDSLKGADSEHAHAHDFLAVAYYERGGGSLRIGQRQWQVRAGDAYVVAPGELVGVGDDLDGLAQAEGWTVFFPPEGLGSHAPHALLAWRAHPLLFPFVRGAGSGAQKLTVPATDRRAWSERFASLELELRERRDGYHEAAVAHLTLLLVDLARLATDVVGDLRLNDEPLLAGVFAFIEARYHEHISLKDVASAVSMSPAHLTTTVRRKTGRTVQDWIAERRMVQARRLLVETDLTVEEIGQRVGYRDPAYFGRSFRHAHRITPLRWRQMSRL